MGTIDTGVRGTHEALKSNAMATDSWKDAIAGKLVPYDDVGHGTHTMGSICGTTRGIGVAPGSKWMGTANLYTPP